MSTADVFISYARDDAPTARRFADALEASGLNVWWDDALRSGEVFDEAIEGALRAAKAVVVLWSPRSVQSRWVRAEATLADRQKTLVPVMIEACERPIIFELTHTPDLSAWQGGAGDPAFASFADHVRDLVGKAGQPAPNSAAEAIKAMPLRKAAICVLPFANMSRDEDQEYFADGITEDVITDLSKVSALAVISRNSAFTFKGKHVDIPDLARQLNVSHVVEGSVRKAGNRVRVTAQLIDGSTNEHVWAERWDRDLDDIFELQDELAKAIVDALKIKLMPAEKKAIEARGTSDLVAYDLYIRARALHFTLGLTEVEQAISLYRQATDRDPKFVRAWAGFSAAMSNARIYEPDRIAVRWGEVVHACQKASDLAPDDSDTITARAFISMWDYDWAEIQRALDKVPVSAGTIVVGGLGLAQLALGQASGALERMLATRAADPLSIGVSFNVQFTLDAVGRLEEADAEYERSKGLLGPRVTMEWRAATRAMSRGDREEARRVLADRFEGNTHFMAFLPRLVDVFDQPEAALEILREVQLDPAYRDGARQAAIANFAVFFGDHDLAIAALRKGLADQKHGVAFGDIWFPNLAPLRRDPRFKDIVRDVRLADFWRESGQWGDFARPLGKDDFEIIA